MKKTETDTIQIKNHTHQKNQTNQGSDNMQGWEIKKLKELGITQTGTTPKTSEKENYGDYIPFIKPADVDFDGNGKLRYDNEGLSVIGLSKARKIEENSIFMVCIGATIGKVGFSELESTCNQQINTLTLQKDYYPKFFYYGMTTKEFQEKVLLEGKGAQATLPIINKSKWENLTLPYPKSLPEQQRIVSILDECFAAIDKAKANAEQNLKNAKELFESYLQGVFENGKLKWEEKTLDEVCEFRNGAAHEQHIDEDGKYILVNSKFISADGEKFKRTNSALAPLYVNDIAFVMSDVPNGKALAKCFLVNENDTYTLNQRIGAIKSKAFVPEFLVYQFNRNKYLLSFNNGENQTNLRKSDILKCPLWVPAKKEQQTIVRKLDALRAETQKLEAVYQKKIDDLEELKKSILQKAFAGELRGGKTAEPKTEKSRRDGKIIKNKINNNKQTPKG